MDLLTLDLNAHGNRGAWVDILHPVTREPIGVRIRVLGLDSDAVQAAIERDKRERLEALKSAAPLYKPATDEAEERRALALLAAATTDWEGVALGDEVLTCNPANCTRLYGHKGMRWLRDQVDAAVASRALFLKP